MLANQLGSFLARCRYALALLILLIVNSCKEDDSQQIVPAFGALSVVVATIGEEIDSDGYLISVERIKKRSAHVDPNAAIRIDSLPAGYYLVRVEGRRLTCDLPGIGPYPYKHVQISSGQTTEIEFIISCTSKPILYSSETEGVFRINMNSTFPVFLHSGEDPVWSPDGSEIALWVGEEKGLFTGKSGLYVLNEDGSNSKLLAENAKAASWSPDGSQLVTILNNQLFTLKKDGSELTQITNLNGEISDPDWGSITDSRIVFGYKPLEGDSGIFVINPDGSQMEQLSYGVDGQPSWSGSGSQIAFVRNDSSIYILNVADNSLTQFTTSGDVEYAPSWSPDDTHLIFSKRAIGFCDDGWYGAPCVQSQIRVRSILDTDSRYIGYPTTRNLKPDWRPEN